MRAAGTQQPGTVSTNTPAHTHTQILLPHFNAVVYRHEQAYKQHFKKSAEAGAFMGFGCWPCYFR